MRKVCWLAALAIVSGTTLAAAQGPEHGKQGGGRGAPAAGPRPAPQRASPPAPRAAPPHATAPQRPAARAPQAPPAAAARANEAAARRAAEQQRAAEQRRAAGHRAVQQQQQRRAAEQQRANERKQQADKQRASDRQAAERQRAEEQKRAAEQNRAPKRPDQALRPGTNQPISARHEQLRQERAKLSTDQRTRLRQSFTVNRDRITRVHFTRRIGTRIPRSVRLFAVPAAVLAILPYYRDYRYVVEEDTICIVDPETYEIVDVLDDGTYAPSTRPQVAELTLTNRERSLVLDSIPPDFPQTRLRLRLALGAEIPPSIELYEFAPLVLDRVPKLRDFRFVVSEDQLVIVEPQDRSIALVLDR